MKHVLKQIHNNVECCVRINAAFINCFLVNSGLKQGCIISPILFNLYINDLAPALKDIELGSDIGGEHACLLLFADDIVCMVDNESDLQSMFNILHD